MIIKVAGLSPKLNYNIFFIAALALLCALATMFPLMGILISICEIVYLLYVFFVRRKIEDYLFSFLTITATCLDTQLFVYGESEKILYSFVNLPIIHGYHLLFLTALPLLEVFSLKNWRNFRKRLTKNKYLTLAFVFNTVIYCFGLITILPSLLLDENEILKYIGIYFVFYRKQFFLYSCVFFLVIDFSYCFCMIDSARESFAKYLYNLLFGMGIAIICSFLFGWSSQYQYGTVLLLSQCSFFVIALLLMPYHNVTKNPACIFVALLSCVVMLRRASALAGKWWLFVFLTLTIMVILLMSQKNVKFHIKLLGWMLVTGGTLFLIVSAGVNRGYGHSEYKFQQALRMISVFREDWYKQLPDSPKARIEEIINITIEYLNKPFYLLLGKGYGGTISHHWGMVDWGVIGSTFSAEEISIGYYTFVHETINCLYLSSGLFGLTYFIYETLYFMKNVKKDVSVLIGYIWFLFFFASSYISLWLGIACLVYGKTIRNKAE